jgi:hypothetical protein
MHVHHLLAAVLIFSSVLAGCDGGSGHSQNDAAPDSPPPTQADVFTMPPMADVLPPSADFNSICIDGLPLVDDVVPPPVEDTTEGGDIGFLIDSAASGVSYETPTHRGVTGPGGSFRYASGESIRFSLGDTTLGKVAGRAQVSPFDLAGASVPDGMRDITAALEDDDHPFQAVISTAVLLQSLDRDGDLANGIEITPEVAALFDGVSLDLSRPWREIPNQFWLNHAIAQANVRGFFSGVHGVVNPAHALQQLYTTLGIDARTMGVSMEESDWDGDGTTDNSVKYQYDAGGNLTRAERPEGTFGIREVESWTWDANGNSTTYEREASGRESTERRQYDTQGKLTQVEVDDDDDGAPETSVNFEYAADGRPAQIILRGNSLEQTAERLDIPTISLLSFAKTYTVTYGYDADGNPTGDVLNGFNAELGRHVVTRTYDDHGNAIRSEGRLERFDVSEPVTVTLSKYQYEYDGSGNITRKSFDEDGDGRAERETSYKYDGSGNVIRESVHSGGNELYITDYEYDSYGNLVRSARDNDADGTPEEVETWPYQYETDAQGKLVRRVLDRDGDGRPEETLDYAYNADGRLDHEDRLSIEGAEYESSTWRYDASGKLTREEWDDGADGVADRITGYAYDACGNLLDQSVSREEGNPVSTEHWRYDADGNLRRYEWNNTAIIDGAPDDFLDIFQSTGFESWQHDTDGRLMRYQGECESGACSFDYYNFVNQIVNYEYDDAGNLARELVDRDGDGRPDRVTVYEYDAAGNVTRQQWDSDGDGTAERVESYEYDTAGNITRELAYENGDRRPGQVSYEYGDDNRLTRREDIGADGKLNSIATFEYDARGNLLREASKLGDGYEYGISVHTYDAKGNRTRTEEDREGDGVVDTIRSWEYDADGNLVREREVIIDEEARRVEFSHSYHYDADSNLVRESEGFDRDGDGVPDEDTTRYYIPTGWGHLFSGAAAR